nr:MAG TPA: hypothetical protein [Caudoviricetes sp.]
MKEKLMERFNWKLSKFCEISELTLLVIDYRYGELTGIVDTMRECNIINKKEHTDFIKLIDYIYSTQQRNILLKESK